MFPECFFDYPVRKLLNGKIILAKWFQRVPLDTCFANHRELRLQCKMIPACVSEKAPTPVLLCSNGSGRLNLEARTCWGWGRNWCRLVSIMMSKWNETIVSVRIELQPPRTKHCLSHDVPEMLKLSISSHCNSEALCWRTKAALYHKKLQNSMA